jgi:hypothetical protein
VTCISSEKERDGRSIFRSIRAFCSEGTKGGREGGRARVNGWHMALWQGCLDIGVGREGGRDGRKEGHLHTPLLTNKTNQPTTKKKQLYIYYI